MVKYKPKSCGWLSQFFDPILEDSSTKLSLSLDNVTIWMTEGYEDEWNSPSPLALSSFRLLMLVSPPPSFRSTSLPAQSHLYYEIVPVPEHRSFLSFAIRESGRRVRREMVFCSDYMYSLCDFAPSGEKRLLPWPIGTENAAGNLFGLFKIFFLVEK